LIIIGACLIVVGLMAVGPKVHEEAAIFEPPAVNVIEVQPQTVQLHVKASGTVEAQMEIELVPQVTGTVSWVSPAMVSGGFFKEGEILVKVDRREYENQLERAKVNLQRRESDYERADRELARIRDLFRQKLVSDAELEDSENSLVVAEADLRSARIDVVDAERDLSFTEIRAPFTGRVRAGNVALGGIVDFRGEPIATIYSIDFAEIRLPIADDELMYIPSILWKGTGNSAAIAESGRVPVTVQAKFAGAQHRWAGYIVRTEGEIDSTTRMVHVVARVDAPYDQGEEGVPLTVGLFVDALITGNKVENIIILPRASLRNQTQVRAIDSDNRLLFRDVDILRLEGDRALIKGGLQKGDRVVVSHMKSEVAGMTVTPATVPVEEDGLPEGWRL
jgi:RND family efflux transporter MFP subunit